MVKPQGVTGRLAARGHLGAVATAHPLATRAAMDVLRNGGNAVDAAVAAGAVMNVCEPHTSQLGGDAFMLVLDGRTGQVTAVNGSGPAPAATRPEAYDGTIPLRGYRSTTVPGEVAAWDLALRLLGTRPLGELLGPAIGYAAYGFPVSRHLAAAIAANAEVLRRCPEASRTFLPDGSPPEVGDTLVQPELADTLRALGIGGSEELYRRGLADVIAECFASNGGYLAAEDLRDYRAERLRPLCAHWRGMDVHVQPPMSQAHVMLEAFLIAEPFAAAANGPLDPEWVHVCVEATKLAYADRYAYAGDTEAARRQVQMLLSPAHVESRRQCLDTAASGSYQAGLLSTSDTTQLAVADRHGNAVCLIQSLFHAFGCGVMVPGTGIVMNNRLTGFDTEGDGPNLLAPGKRPVHTLSTYLVTNEAGALCVVGGTPGGMRQIQTNLQVLSAILAFGDDPQVAVELPRWSVEEGGVLCVEESFGAAVLGALRAKRHQVRELPTYGLGGCAQVITRRDDGLYAAGSDPRGDGHAEAL